MPHHAHVHAHAASCSANIRGVKKMAKTRELSDDQLHIVTALVAAFQGRFQEASNQFCAAKEHQKAIDMFTDLRKWDDAKKLAQQFEGTAPPIMAEMSGGSLASTFKLQFLNTLT